MARLATQSQTAASGLDLTSDPVSMSLTRARRLVNFLIDRPGQVRANVRLVDQLPLPLPNSIDGLAWYYQAAIKNSPFDPVVGFYDLLLYISAGFLFGGRGAPNPLIAHHVSSVSLVGGGITGYVPFACFFTGKHVRSFALGSEILFVQEGGLLPLRVYFSPTLGNGFFRAGIEPPTVANLTLTATATGLTGTWGYKLTYADERFRESSPTPVVDIALVNQATHVVSGSIGTFTPPTSYGGSNLRYAYLYRNTIGAPDVFYQIARHTIPTTNPASVTFGAGDFYFDGNAYDDAPDVDITGGDLAPNPGENDPPLPASIGVIHKNLVFLNDINDPNTLQISNQGSVTQFAVFSILPTDGGRFEIGTDQGNVITALVEFGSILAIFKRRGSYFLYGDNLSDFVVRPVHQRGCIAADSACRCDNVVCFLSDDGVYAAAYEGGDVVTKISKEIEADLLQQPIEDRELSIAWFVDNRYHLAVGQIIYVYDFDAQGWTCYQLGSSGGFGNLGNSGLYGSVGVGVPVVNPPPQPTPPTPAPLSPPGGNCTGTDLIHWWKADGSLFSDLGITPIANGGTVEQWNDAGTGSQLLNLTNATSGKRPTWNTNQQNLLPTVSFDGVDDFLASDALVSPVPLSPTGFSMFVVAKLRTWVNNAYLVDWNDDFSLVCDWGGVSPAGIIHSNGWQGHGIPADLMPGQYSIFQMRADPSLPTILVQVNDGVQQTTIAAASGILAGHSFFMGSEAGTNHFCAIDIAEVLFYNCELTQEVANQVLAYLNNKWAIY